VIGKFLNLEISELQDAFEIIRTVQILNAWSSSTFDIRVSRLLDSRIFRFLAINEINIQSNMQICKDIQSSVKSYIEIDLYIIYMTNIIHRIETT